MVSSEALTACVYELMQLLRDHASPEWRFITITDTDTSTFSKSWKRKARFPSTPALLP